MSVCAEPVDHYRRSQQNWFTGEDFDRIAHRRVDQPWFEQQLRSSATRLVVTWRSSSLMNVDGSLSPRWLPASEHAALIESAASVTLLGEYSDNLYVGVDINPSDEALAQRLSVDGDFVDLQEKGLELTREDAAILAYARGLGFWHRRHRYCTTCGAPARSQDAGHLRVCTSSHCAAKHFPRTDPAVIVLIHYRDRALIARQRGWPERLYSVIAGFVEPGESLEETVCREAAEETGLRVTDIEYRSSQPWPFPSSLMLGFSARALDDRLHLGDDELADALWFSRRELVEAVSAGQVRLPSQVSISYKLIEEWFDVGDEGALASLGSS